MKCCKKETKLQATAIELLVNECNGVTKALIEVIKKDLEADSDFILHIPSEMPEGVALGTKTFIKWVFKHPEGECFKGIIVKPECEFENYENDCEEVRIFEMVRQSNGNFVTLGDFKAPHGRRCDEIWSKLFFNDAGRFVKCCKNKFSACGKNPCCRPIGLIGIHGHDHSHQDYRY